MVTVIGRHDDPSLDGRLPSVARASFGRWKGHWPTTVGTAWRCQGAIRALEGALAHHSQWALAPALAESSRHVVVFGIGPALAEQTLGQARQAKRQGICQICTRARGRILGLRRVLRTALAESRRWAALAAEACWVGVILPRLPALAEMGHRSPEVRSLRGRH